MAIMDEKRVLVITDDLISVDFPPHLENVKKTLCISYGMANDEEKKALVEKKRSDKQSVSLRNNDLLESDCFEFWLNKELIGYCSISFLVPNQSNEDDDDELPPSFFISLNIIYLLPEYRGIGLGEELRTRLANELARQIFEDIWKYKCNISENNFHITFECDFITDKGEHFFDQLVDMVESELIHHLDNKFPNVTFTIQTDAGF